MCFEGDQFDLSDYVPPLKHARTPAESREVRSMDVIVELNMFEHQLDQLLRDSVKPGEIAKFNLILRSGVMSVASKAKILRLVKSIDERTYSLIMKMLRLRNAIAHSAYYTDHFAQAGTVQSSKPVSRVDVLQYDGTVQPTKLTKAIADFKSTFLEVQNAIGKVS